MSITDWPEDERPRERLIARGPGALTDAELLAIYLRVGIKGKNAVELAKDLLSAFHGKLALLANANLGQLSAIPGIGAAKAAQLMATFELARRAIHQNMVKMDNMNSPEAVCQWLSLNLGHRQREVFMALWLDSQNRLIAADELFEGGLNQASVYPREVAKAALAHNASSVILAHNHPSGIAEPSHADQNLTTQLKQTLALIEVQLLDHIIVAGTFGTVSFAQRGLI
jgi:DNA repair protein RadC